jgi:hypothetical protein
VVCNDEECEPPYLPYVPLYAELESLHMWLPLHIFASMQCGKLF